MIETRCHKKFGQNLHFQDQSSVIKVFIFSFLVIYFYLVSLTSQKIQVIYKLMKTIQYRNISFTNWNLLLKMTLSFAQLSDWNSFVGIVFAYFWKNIEQSGNTVNKIFSIFVEYNSQLYFKSKISIIQIIRDSLSSKI